MRVDSSRRLGDAERTRIERLTRDAADADGVSPLSEQGHLNLAVADEGVLHLLAFAEATGPGDPAGGAELAGYAQVDARAGGEPSAEVVVAPEHRGAGIGRALVRAALDARPDVRLWTHGDLPAAVALAESEGLRAVRVLLKMARALGPTDDFPRDLPPGYRLTTYDPSDGPDWVAVNAAAFADHAEQGRMTLADLRTREQEPWFDPAGFFLVRDSRGDLAAFHWTKVEDGVGEVYVVGVSPAHQGLGLGRAVTAVGLAHLRDAGLPRVELYVDGHNAAAVATYTRQGFAIVSRDVQWGRPSGC